MIRIGLHGGGEFRVATDGQADAVDAADVTPEVLAYGLSHVTRFCGQAGAYNVGEHSVRMFDWAKADGQDKAILRAILLHDAPECLGEGDHQRFVKRAFFGDGPHKYASMVCEALWAKFTPSLRSPAVWTWRTMYDALKSYDEYMGSMEAWAFGFPHEPIPEWVNCSYGPRRGGSPWAPGATRTAFLSRWRACE